MKGSGKRKTILESGERSKFIDFIIDEVAESLYMDREDLLCGPAVKQYSIARHMVMYIVDRLGQNLNLKAIAQNLNYVSHSSAVDGIEKIQEVMDRPANDKLTHARVTSLMESIKIKMGLAPEESIDTILDREAEMILDYKKEQL